MGLPGLSQSLQGASQGAQRDPSGPMGAKEDPRRKDYQVDLMGAPRYMFGVFLQHFKNLNHMFAHIYNTLSTKIAPSWTQMASK